MSEDGLLVGTRGQFRARHPNKIKTSSADSRPKKTPNAEQGAFLAKRPKHRIAPETPQRTHCIHHQFTHAYLLNTLLHIFAPDTENEETNVT
ncbi:MAG: hypothetical protein P8011_12245 [Acidihalobacter sp.]|uniref:hypothetical protein n=1 Tax=Acidihalobacter sp. TaxID=1872108 RepID=UPI00307D4B95